jgi:hypothetical protein
VFPLKARSTTRFSPHDGPIFVPPSTTLTAAIAGGVITFGGSVGTIPTHVHTIVNGQADARVDCTTNQSLTSVATAVAAAVNALGLSGVSATASGPNVSLSGVFQFNCNVVGSGGTISYEVARIERSVQVTLWASEPVTRSLIADAIVTNVGTTLAPYLLLPDNSGLRCLNDGDSLDDNSQAESSVYIAHILLDVEYGINQISAVSQLGAVQNIIVGANNAVATVWVGGTSLSGGGDRYGNSDELWGGGSDWL